MVFHYINTCGIRGTAMGGVLVPLDSVKAVGGFWPATEKDSAFFDVIMDDGSKMTATFDASIPLARQMGEHARLIKELVRKHGVVTDFGIEENDIEFESVEKSEYDATDPDGAWLLTGKVLGAAVAYVYQMDAVASDNRESVQKSAIDILEKFAVKCLGDTMAMDEYAKSRDTTEWKQSRNDPELIYAEGFGEPIE